MLTPERKTEIIKEYAREDKDTGSPEVQISLLSAKIVYLTDHFRTHPKDVHSRRGLLKMVARRRRLLDYLHNTNSDKYKEIIKRLDLRK
ncbi:MAG: 30S ribosomal protein S15 [Deltaproteobacteria bacterium]|nr:30S ribosomal protein S15 [Deltaproteobacteria bacterium]